MKTNLKFLVLFAIATIMSVCFSAANVTSQAVDDSSTLSVYDAQAFDVADLFGGDPFMIVKYDCDAVRGYIDADHLTPLITDAKSERMELRYRQGINNEKSHSDFKSNSLKGKPTIRYLAYA